MLILSIDPGGLNLDWCVRCVAAGHTVKMWTKGSRASHIGEGLVDKVDDWRPYAKVADLIFSADNLELMDEIDELMRKGYPVFGPGKRAAKLELNRMYGQDIIKEFGGPVIPSHEFKNYDALVVLLFHHMNSRTMMLPLTLLKRIQSVMSVSLVVKKKIRHYLMLPKTKQTLLVS